MSKDKYVTDWPNHLIIDSDKCDLKIDCKDGIFNVKQTQGRYPDIPYHTNIPYKGDVSPSLMRIILEISEAFYKRGVAVGKAKKQEEIKKALGCE